MTLQVRRGCILVAVAAVTFCQPVETIRAQSTLSFWLPSSLESLTLAQISGQYSSVVEVSKFALTLVEYTNLIAAAVSTGTEPDLAIIPKDSFRRLADSLADLSPVKYDLINASLRYVQGDSTFALPPLATSVPILGVELPGASDFVVAIFSTSPNVDFALQFLLSFGPSPLEFNVVNQVIVVKAFLLTHTGAEDAYGIQMRFDKHPEDADIDRKDWRCEVVKDKDVICRGETNSLKASAEDNRIAVAVAFINEAGNVVKDGCYFMEANGSTAGGC